jgi:hypothetical protein
VSESTDRASRVAALRSSLGVSPIARSVGGELVAGDAATELAKMFKNSGSYGAAFYRAKVQGDPDAAALIERASHLMREVHADDVDRAVSHQLMADNPGLIPRPILGSVIDRFTAMRPLIAGITNYPATAPKFDRPKVTQHVAIGKQTLEKTEMASRKMVVGALPVELDTYGGTLNISKQDLRWSSPSLLDLVFQSYGKEYAKDSDTVACTEFVAGVTQTVEVSGLNETAIDTAVGTAGAIVAGTSGDLALADTIFLGARAARSLALIRNPLGAKIYNIPLLGHSGGDFHSLKVVIDPRFPQDTAILGDAANGVEYWESMEGFLTIDEPSVNGLLTGYAGYGRLVVTAPEAFVKINLPIITKGK